MLFKCGNKVAIVNRDVSLKFLSAPEETAPRFLVNFARCETGGKREVEN